MANTTVGAESAPAKTFTVSENAACFAGGVAHAAMLASVTLGTILDAGLIEGCWEDPVVRHRVDMLLRRAARDLAAALDGRHPGHDEFDTISAAAGASMYL